MAAHPAPAAQLAATLSLFEEMDPEQPDPFRWHDDERTVARVNFMEDEPAAPPAHGLAIVPKRSLSECVNQVEAIADTIESLDDDSLTPEVRDDLSRMLIEAIAGTREKIDRTTSVLAMFEHLETAAAAEAERLKKRATYYARQRDRLETYVLAVLEASKLDRLDGNTSTVTVRRNPAKVVIIDETLIPLDFMRQPEPPPPAPDKKAIAAVLKTNPIAIPGARLEASKRLVRS